MGGGPNGPTFKNIGFGLQVKKNVLWGMRVNLVYNIFDPQQQEETKTKNYFSKLTIYLKIKEKIYVI